MNTNERVREIIAESVDLSVADIDDDMTLDELDVDSLSIVHILMELQQQLSITLSEDEIDVMDSVAAFTARLTAEPA